MAVSSRQDESGLGPPLGAWRGRMHWSVHLHAFACHREVMDLKSQNSTRDTEARANIPGNGNWRKWFELFCSKGISCLYVHVHVHPRGNSAL